MAADDLPIPPTLRELETWAGAGRVRRATELDVATWRLPEPQKAALIFSGVPMIEDLVHGVSFQTTPMMYRLAYFDDEDKAFHHAWDYGALPDTGEVREWGRQTRFVNSTVNHWLCSLHLVGTWVTHSNRHRPLGRGR
ncbi:SUKH-4 family immunity protein [Micromonospora sp. NPDC004540]|uniref:SUKH-4 family immunity protein n=1 Tax=Micromonospora sp. NPDC004540 TaxID=3154457 RepID=UPI0033BCE61D